MKILDEDLKFLSSCPNDDLRVLTDYLTTDKDGKYRWCEELTKSQVYQDCYPDKLPMMWSDIAHELQKFGGNTILNAVRGHGIPYHEILIDVCKHMKVNFNKNATIELIEDSLLRTVAEKAIEGMSMEDMEDLIKSANIKTASYSKEAMVTALQIAIRMGGFASYKIAVIVANGVCRALLGRGLSLAMNAGLTRYMAVFAGPIGWLVTAIWTAADSAGPAYRVTIPCCIQIAFMRKMYCLTIEEKRKILQLPLL